MSRNLNFLHLSTFYPPYSFGGDAIYLYHLCHALGDAGHHCDVIHCVDSYYMLHPAEPQLRFVDHPNVSTHGLRSGYKWLSPLLSQQTGRPLLKRSRIQEVFDSKPYDVIHYHNISLLGPTVLTLEPRQSPALKLYTTLEHWLICPTHVLWKFNRKPCDSPDCLKCILRHKRPPQLWRYTGLLERTSRHVDQFLSPSRFTARMHAERGFSRPVEYLPLFTGYADRDWQQPGARPHDKPYFLFVGRLEYIKGLQSLIALWKRVPDYDLLVVGRGTYEAELRTQAAGDPRIRFLGSQTQQQLGTLYYHALACLVPSLTYETFGLICVEAFARKTPAIVRDLGALPEMIRDSHGGFVYRNDEELLAALQRIGASPALRAELGENGYQAFVRSWSREAHLERYFDCLRKTALRKFGWVPWEDTQEENRTARVATASAGAPR
jgi:glycosyltransferase involved in cell wall biosynthesis